MDNTSWNLNKVKTSLEIIIYLQVVGLGVSAYYVEPKRGRGERGSASLRGKNQHLGGKSQNILYTSETPTW